MQITEATAENSVEILLIRHGETAWNKEQRMQGHLDIALNEEGQRQAQALAVYLANEPLDAIFCSDMQRTQQTIAPLAHAQGMTVQLDAGLRERCYGGFEGLRRPEIKSRFPHAFAAMIERDVDARHPPGENIAETLNEFFQRTVDALHRIIRQAQTHQRIAIITHGGVLDCLYRYAQNMPLAQHRDFDILNASINRMLWDGQRLQIKAWGNVGHLQMHGQNKVLDEIVR